MSGSHWETVPDKSPWNVLRSVLMDRGHTVTVFTPFVGGNQDGHIEVNLSEQTVPTVGVNMTYLMEKYGKKRVLSSLVANVTRPDCDTN